MALLYPIHNQMLRKWRNRTAAYRRFGRQDGLRGIPHVTTRELPEALQQLEHFGNQELAELAEAHISERRSFETCIKTLDNLGIAKAQHLAATEKQRGDCERDCDESRKRFFAFNRRNPTTSAGAWLWVEVLLVMAVVLFLDSR